MNRLQKNWTVMTFRFNRLTRIPSITVLGDFSDLCIHSLLLDPIYLAAAGSKYKISRPCLIVIESCFSCAYCSINWAVFGTFVITFVFSLQL